MGEEDRTNRGFLVGRRFHCRGREKLFVDSYCARLRGAVGMSGRRVGIAPFRKIAFSSHKAMLVALNEANYCWLDSC